MSQPDAQDPRAIPASSRMQGLAGAVQRMSGGPGTPLFRAAAWARRNGAQSVRSLRQLRHRAMRFDPRAGEEVRKLDGLRVRARVDPNATPEDVHLRTAVWLRDLLEANSIEYFTMPRDSLRVDLGIRAADAESLRELISREWARRAITYGLYGTDQFFPEAPNHGPPEGSFSRARAVRIVLATGPAGVDWAWSLNAGVSVHFWTELGDEVWGAPIPNRYTPYLLRSARDDVRPLECMGEEFQTFRDFAVPHIDDVTFPVDLVYTWVNGRDPEWRSRMLRARQEVLGGVTDNAVSEARFTDLEELRYSLRSVHAFAPWINRIWIVTDGQVPSWFSPFDDRVTFIDHHEIWEESARLPVFNSHAIESRLHHIPGLAEHYIYFNDDMVFGSSVEAADFFTPGGLLRLFPSSHQIPLGPTTLIEGAAQTAGKNDRDVLVTAAGAMQTQRLKHAGYPQLRSVALELEGMFKEEYRRTSAATFRSVTDLSCVSLQSWYAYRTGRGVKGTIPFRYVDLVTAADLRQLDWIGRRRDVSVICINQSRESLLPESVIQAKVRRFLDDLLPVPSPYESAR